MKRMKKLWAYLLVVAMLVTFMPGNTYVKAATDITYGFHVSGSKLLDANGNLFVMRGINHAHTWYKDQSTTAIKAMAKAGANTVRVVLVNIANEWDGTWESSTWKAGYIAAIKKIRDAGIKNTLMVDAAGWGQYPKSIAESGKAVFASDPLANTMFSTHMYEYAGGSASMVKNNIDSVAKTGLCQAIGEFGWKHTDGDVAEETIMSYCQKKGIGYMAWSWKGNSGGVGYLDLANDWAGTSLSDWGNEIVNGTNWLKETSKICSVFTDATVSQAPESSASNEPTKYPCVTSLPPVSSAPVINPPSKEVSVSDTPVSEAPVAGSVNLFKGSKEATSWSNVLELTAVKDGGTFDSSMITKDGYFTVEYTGDKDAFELVFQSWSGGAGWAEVTYSQSTVNTSGNYVSKISYSDIVSVYGDKFDALDRLYVKTTNGSIVLKSLNYVTVASEPVQSVAPVESKEPVITKEPVKSEQPVISEEPVKSEEPAVSVEPSKPVTNGKINFFSGSKEVSAWQTALELSTKKNGGTFDPAVITKEGYLAVKFTGTKDSLQVIFQSWTGGSGWAVVKPNQVTSNADGSYTAVFDYDTVTAAYGTSYDLLDRIYVQTQNDPIVLQSVDYVTGKIAPAVSAVPSVEPSAEPSMEPSKEPTVSSTPSEEPKPDGMKSASHFATEENVKHSIWSIYSENN